MIFFFSSCIIYIDILHKCTFSKQNFHSFYHVMKAVKFAILLLRLSLFSHPIHEQVEYQN